MKRCVFRAAFVGGLLTPALFVCFQLPGGWWGINYWADKLGDVCDEVIEQDGFDTKYMRFYT